MAANNIPPAEEPALLEPSFDAELFWAKNRTLIIGAAIAVVVAAVSVIAWIVNDHNSQLAAQEQFAEAKDVAGWRAVISNYPHSMPAANAYFLLAQALRDEGKFAESTTAYQDLLKEFPKHPLAAGASLGMAENLDLQGKSAEALAALREVEAGDSSNYAAPFAALLEGRILMREGKLVDAQRVLSTAYNLFKKSPAGRAAGMQGEELNSVIPSTEGKGSPILR